MEMAVPVKPRCCCKAEVRCVRAVRISMDRAEEVGIRAEEVIRVRWRYVQGRLRIVSVCPVDGLAANGELDSNAPIWI